MCPQMLNETNNRDLTCLRVPRSGLALSDNVHGISGQKCFHACKNVGNRLPASS